MAQGEEVFKSVQVRGLANARKELQKNLWSFQTHRCLKSILVSGWFCLTCTRDKNPSSSERREYAQGPWQSGSCLPWSGRWARKRADAASFQSHPSPLGGRRLRGPQQPSVWQEMGVVRGTSLQKLNYSGQTAGRPSCGRVCWLRKPPRRRGAIGKGMLCQGSLLHWRW